MDNKMNIWNALDKPPKNALKEIKGGRLKGMTDIKPQWRYKAMTEYFGPCGVGWKYTIKSMEVFDGNAEQKVCVVNVDLFYKHNDTWSDAIPGTGGAMLVTKESAGLHTSDEGFKMALTDALSVAMSRIGVAAEIYMGNWTGTKYKEDLSLPKSVDNDIDSEPMSVMEFDELLGKAKDNNEKRVMWTSYWEEVKPQCGEKELEKFKKICEEIFKK